MSRISRAVWLTIFLVAIAMPLAASDDFRLYLNYATFDPKMAEPTIPAQMRSKADPGHVKGYLVQFDGPIQDSWKDSLSQAGAEIIDYIPNFAFLVKMTPETAKCVQSIPHVRWVGIYHAAYKIDKRLLKSTGTARIRLKLQRAQSAESVASQIRQLGSIVSSDTLGGSFKASASTQNLAKIAQLDDVEWIEPEPEYKLFNDIARGITGVNTLWSVDGLYGAGEIVAVCDTGLDTGDLATISSDFAGRVLATHDLGRTGLWNDPQGHGTHVSGTVLGSGSLSGSNPGAHSYTSSFAGAAPEAKLVMQSVLDSTGGLNGLPSDLNTLFQQAYNDGARVHNNSWGSSDTGVYTVDAQNLDSFVWNHPDMAIIFSAGNSGSDANKDGVVDLSSMDSPATAKNCISVGASENLRLSNGYQGTYSAFRDANSAVIFQTNPIYSDKVSNNSSGMAAFSSRGPTNDGRIKPDVIAPGTNILSCRSHVSGASTGWGAYDANYVFNGGTSMSAPLVTGATALVRQYYRTIKNVTPSAALLKATLINSATDINPGQYGTGSFLEIPSPRPNNVEGWGLINPAYAIAPAAPRSMNFIDNTTGLRTNKSATYTYSISGNPSPFRITLVWSDYPASTAASKALVNDLDLTVTAPDLTLYRGNGATDRLNNVESIDIPNPVPGDYIVTVTAYNVPHGPQPYALVTTGAFGPLPPKAVIDSPVQNEYLYGPIAISGTATGADFYQYKLEYGSGSTPSAWLSIGNPQTAPVVSNLLGTWDTSGLANGTYTIKLTSTSGGGTTSSQVSVNVLKTSIRDIKTRSDGASVTLTGKAISAIFNGFFYVEEPNRTGGMRINTSAPTNASLGSLLTVTGTLTTTPDGERAVANPNLTVTLTK